MATQAFADTRYGGGSPHAAPSPRREPGALERAAIASPSFLAHAQQIEREHPEHLAALGVTAEEYAEGMTGPSLSVEDSVAAGWMSAAEGRFILGQATLADSAGARPSNR